MPEGKREVVAVTERCKITERELDQAFHTCDDAFWAQAVELFPEAKTGDTEPGATGHYQEVVKAYMKHWLSLNTRIKVGGLTESDAVDVLWEVANYASESQVVTGTPETEVTIEGRGQKVTLKVVSLTLGDSDQGYGVIARNPATGNTVIGTRDDDFDWFLNRVINGKDEPDE